MIRFIILLSTIWTCWCYPHINRGLRKRRIVNGTLAGIIPYQASLESNGIHLCGGTIISKRIILTAAHCVATQNIESLIVRVGTNKREQNGQVISVRKLIVHPHFDWTGNADIAVVFLQNSMRFNRKVKPIPMANKSNKPKIGSSGIISGWGYESEGSGYLTNDLMFGVVKIFDLNICKRYFNDITSGMLCAGNLIDVVDACNRDSGGPFVSEGKLVGIISAGIGCASNFIPGLYIDVSYFKPWIDVVIELYAN